MLNLARRGQAICPQDEPVDSPFGVHGLPTAPAALCLRPCMLKFGEFGVNAGFCFGKLFTARMAFEFIARASAHGVNSLPFILKPNSCLLADFGPRICKDGV